MSKKVLIIDDDTYLRELYEEVVRDGGYTVETACDGEEGLAKIKQGAYDLILLDIVMPKLDGLGVLQELKAETNLPKNGPIIVLTNLAHDPILQEALNSGAKSYLIKTDITPDDLLQHLQQFLQ